MAQYKVIAEAYINNRLISKAEIEAAGEAGVVIEFDGKVRPEYDLHLEPVNKAAEKAQVTEAKDVDDDTRAEAIKLKLTEDGKADGKPIDEETPIEVVELRMAEYKSSNVFK